MKKLTLLTLILSLMCGTPALATEADPVLSALTDEMANSMKNLHLDIHPPPYYLSYTVREIDDSTLSSCLGAPSVFDHSRERFLTPVVKVGNYDLDSSFPLSTRPDPSVHLPIDDNYAAVRRGVWLDTDREYKYAVRMLEWKKAYLAANNVANRLTDFTHEKPVVAVEALTPLVYDEKKWTVDIPKLSAVFKNYPGLQKSKVTFVARAVHRWYVNSEGSRVRETRPFYAVRIWASAQSADGMPVEDSDLIASPQESTLPDFEMLKQRTEALAKRVSDVRSAPKAEEYWGPVLFEDQAAAEIFATVMAPNFGFAEEYIGTEDFVNPLKNRLGRKVLNKELTLFDDPSCRDKDGNLLIGTYKYDDDGMPAQKVCLVENGMLKGFVQSRIPTRHCDKSNGHSMRGHGVFSNLELSSSKTMTKDELMAQLSELGKDAGLDYVLVVSRMKDDYDLPSSSTKDGYNDGSFVTPSHSIKPDDPIIVEKLYLKDGHRELVRGLEFTYVSLRSFRDIQAVGNDAKPYTISHDDGVIRSFITPSYVIGELEMTPVTPEHAAPPILPSPLQVSNEKAK